MKTFPLAAAIAVAMIASPAYAHPPDASHEAHLTNATPAAAAAAATAAAPAAVRTATHAAMRDLWVEHVFWIRSYVAAGVADDAAQQKVAADQVVANAKAISAAVAGFYGDAAGDQLLTLLAGHWGAVQAHADATRAGDAAAQTAALETLTANAKAIAAFLAGANPYLPEATLVNLLVAHGAHHVAQNRQLTAGDYAAEAKTWAAMRAHMFTIADALTDAIGRQFPGKI